LALDDPLTAALFAAVVIIACFSCFLIYYSMKKRQSREKPPARETKKDLSGLPLRLTKSVPSDEASEAKEELRTLDVEREILADAIRRLYEAHAEGKITEEERERLAESYKSRMMTVKDAISKNESLVALHELEAMQEDLMKLFSERFDELSTKIEELRTKTEVKPIKEISIPTQKTPPEPLIEEAEPATEEKVKRRKKPPAKPSLKTEAERRIEEIRSEVEKVLDRLGQMEVES
jgi:hypothetical protein